jgi:hypothetical protein
MLAFAAAMLQQQSRLSCQFIAVSHVTIDGSGNARPSFAAASVGDLGVVIGEAGSTTPPSGWALAGSFTAGLYTAPVFYKVLTSGDISTAPTFTGNAGGQYTALMYRGPKTASLLANTPWTTSDTSKSVSSAKPAGTKGLVVAAVSSSNVSLTGAPTGTTLRDNFSSGGTDIAVADLVTPLKYGGGALTWTSIPSSQGALGLVALL